MAYEGWIADLLGIQTISTPADGGTALPQRKHLRIEGATVEDDPVNGWTRLAIAAPGGGGAPAQPVTARMATTSPVPLSGLIVVDGIQANDGDVVLVKDNDPPENGLYITSDVQWQRVPGDLTPMMLVGVDQGDFQADSVWMLTTNGPIALGSSDITFQPVGSGDARSLRGVALDPTVAGALDEDVLAYEADVGGFVPTKLRDGHIDDDADIAVTKLRASNTNGQVLRTMAGVPAWGSLTPADLGENVVDAVVASDQDNWAPAGWNAASLVRVTPTDAPRSLRGLGPAQVRRKTIVNVGAFALTLVASAPGQAPGNEILSPRTLALAPGQGAVVVQDGDAWRVVDAAPAAATTFVDPITFAAGLTTTGSVLNHATAEYVYADLRARSVLVPLQYALPENPDAPGWVGDGSTWLSTAASGGLFDPVQKGLRVPLRLPQDATLTTFTYGIRNDAGVSRSSNGMVQAIAPNFATGAATEQLIAAMPFDVSAAAGATAPVTRAGINTVIDNSTKAYHLRIAASEAGVRVLWVQVSYLDPGPRNN